MKSVLILAPWFKEPRHIGNIRLNRHIQWFQDAGWAVTIVDSSHEFSLTDSDGITNITIADPLRMHVARIPDAPPPRKPNRLRRWLAYALLSPDPSIVWAKRVMAHPVVRHAARTSSLLYSSSPPEAAFIACTKLSRRYGVPFWMDMRDGWLDEPLKPLLRTSAIQRWREKRLEALCLNASSVITVTSKSWKTMLSGRYPHLNSNIRVVMNAAPASVARKIDASGNPRLMYAGRMGSSRPERDGNDMKRVLDMLPEHRFSVIGSLVADELEMMRRFGWNHIPEMARPALLETLSEAHGLVLLSTSKGSIPAKFFDYLATGRPILGISSKESAAWDVLRDVPQAYAVDPANPDQTVLKAFFEASMSGEPGAVPEIFSETAVKNKFLGILASI